MIIKRFLSIGERRKKNNNEFLSAEEANEIATSYTNKVNDKFVKSYLKEIEYIIKEFANRGEKSVEIAEENGANLSKLTESNEKSITDYLKSKGYKVDISTKTKTNGWGDVSYDYKVFSIKWGEEN